MSLPKISMLVRLTRDPEQIQTQSGTALTKLGLACSEKYKDKETQLFIDGTAFGKTAEFIASVRKGQRVFVWGKIQTESWKAQDGSNRSKISMVIEGFEYIEAKEASPQYQQEGYATGGGVNNPSPQQQSAYNQQQGVPVQHLDNQNQQTQGNGYQQQQAPQQPQQQGHQVMPLVEDQDVIPF